MDLRRFKPRITQINTNFNGKIFTESMC